MTLLNVDTSRARITRVGLDTRITRVRVSLTAPPPGAQIIFSMYRSASGPDLGSVTVRATPETPHSPPATTSVALDLVGGAALQSLGHPRGYDRAAVYALAFPITGGTVNAYTFAGSIHAQRRDRAQPRGHAGGADRLHDRHR